MVSLAPAAVPAAPAAVAIPSFREMCDTLGMSDPVRGEFLAYIGASETMPLSVFARMVQDEIDDLVTNLQVNGPPPPHHPNIVMRTEAVHT